MMPDHAKGLLITVLGVLCVVPDALFARLIEADPATIAFWRAAMSGMLILAGLLALRGIAPFRAAFAAGPLALLYALCMGASGPGFVLAVSLTSVANVVIIIAAMPLFAAIFGRVFLGDRISRRMIWTMGVVALGLAVVAYGTGESAIASWQGDLAAVFVAVNFAAAMTIARRLRAVSLVPMVPVGFLAAALLLWPLATPSQAMPSQAALVLAHGAFMAVSTSLLTLGPRYLPGAEVALLILLESVLAPLLVWAVIGENPGVYAIFGGAIVVGALAVSNAVALLGRGGVRNPPRPRADPAP